MSLEEQISRLNDNVEKQNTLLETMLSKAGAAVADKTAAKPTKTTKAKKEAAGDDDSGAGFDAEKLAEVREKVKGWLVEFKADEDDPETAKRRELLDAALTKLGDGEKITIAEITDDAMVARVEKWIDTKIEAGRQTPEPKKKAAKGGDDDI